MNKIRAISALSQQLFNFVSAVASTDPARLESSVAAS